MSISRLQRAVALGAMIVAGLAGPAMLTGRVLRAAAREPDPGEQLLDRARKAAETHDFVGVVAVAWVDNRGRHQQRVAVSSVAGVLALGGHHEIIGEGPRRFAEQEHGWTALWNREARADLPSPSEKWGLRVRRGPLIAGRRTRVVEAVKTGSSRVRERIFVDVDTELLLRREELDRHGHVDRTVGFVRLGQPIIAGPGVERLRPPHRPELRAPRVVTDVSSPFRAPERAGDGYQLIGRYRLPSGTVQLFYSDGLFGLSVFQQEGTLDWGALPPNGETRTIAGRETRQYRTPAGFVLVWQSSRVVYTYVSDAPVDEADAVIADFAPARHPSLLQRTTDFVLGPFKW